MEVGIGLFPDRSQCDMSFARPALRRPDTTCLQRRHSYHRKHVARNLHSEGKIHLAIRPYRHGANSHRVDNYSDLGAH